MSNGARSIAPRMLVERFLDLVDCGAWHQLPELYADDALIEFPFAQPAAIRLDGRRAIRAHFERARIRLRVIDRKILETSDPEVIVADYRYDGGSIHSERRLIVSNLQIFRIRLGRIITSRDFHDHAALEALLGSSAAFGRVMPHPADESTDGLSRRPMSHLFTNDTNAR